MSIEPSLESLLQRPDLPIVVDQMRARLEDEQRRRAEFRRDLAADMKAEFIGGEVVMHSPAKAKQLRVTDNLNGLLRNFVASHRLGETFTEKALVGMTRNDYEPDIIFLGREKASQIEPDTLTFPSPDFVVEVLSDSTEHRDRGVKFVDYANHNVREYWIIDCDDETIEQYGLRAAETAYHLLKKSDNGEIQSEVIEGFCIPVRAVFDADMNRRTLAKILAV